MTLDQRKEWLRSNPRLLRTATRAVRVLRIVLMMAWDAAMLSLSGFLALCLRFDI